MDSRKTRIRLHVIIAFLSALCTFISHALNADNLHNTPLLQYTWTPASGPVDHYKVFISFNSSAFTLAGQTPNATPSYTLTVGNGMYRAQVQAVDAAGRTGPLSDVSDPVTVSLPVPAGLRISFNEGTGQYIRDNNGGIVGQFGTSAFPDAYDPKWSGNGLLAPNGSGLTPCLRFTRGDNGTDFARLIAVEALNSHDAMTVSLFVNQPRGSGKEELLFYKHGVWDAFKIYLKKGNLHVELIVSGTQYNFRVPAFQLNTWQHIVVTFDGYNILTYLQGQEVGRISSPEARSLGNMIVNDIGYGFSGFIDDVVLVAGSVWTEAEVLAEYQRGLLGIPAAPLQRPGVDGLGQNYPNPFNPETWIPFQLAAAQPVVISIYDAAGTLVLELHLGHREPGYYHTPGRAAFWDGRNLYGERVSSGSYFYRLQTGEYAATRKMVILK